MKTSNVVKIPSGKALANKLLDQILELDDVLQHAYYDMGAALSSLAHGQLYKHLGYSSIRQLVENECSFTPTTAYKYMNAFRRFRALGYSKSEAIDLIDTFGFTRIAAYLVHAKAKVGVRAIANAIEKAPHVINFLVTPAEQKRVDKALAMFGAYESEHGQRQNATAAFMAIIDEALGQ